MHTTNTTLRERAMESEAEAGEEEREQKQSEHRNGVSVYTPTAQQTP